MKPLPPNLIKDEDSGEPIGLEVLSYRPGNARFDVVSVHVSPPPVPAH